jgi:ABC-type multidrug transport system fused ATPase/permease subunit
MTAATSPVPSDRETVALLARALRYAAPFRGRLTAKFGLVMLSLVPRLLLPWPVKIIIDHVIRGVPVGDPSVPYPTFLWPLLAPLEGLSSSEILLWMLAIQAVLVIFIGALGSTAAEVDHTEDDMASGRDMATRTENEANWGHSFVAGLLGLFEFRFTLRLTQAFNHHYRSRLFERIQALPITAFDDARIGDAVHRLMYDTPSITRAVYRLLLVPTAGVVALLITVGALRLVYGDTPGIAWSAFGFLPLSVIIALGFGALLRRRARAAREAGATTTTSLEEGFANIVAVQSLGAEDRQRGRFERDSWAAFGEYRALVRVMIAAIGAGAIPALALSGWLYVTLTDLVIRGELSTGDFAVVFIYFAQIAGYSTRIGSLWLQVQDAAAGLSRVFSLMDQPAEEDRADAQPLAPVRRGVRVEDLHVRYPDGTEAVRGVSFEAPVGSLTALVGPAGAGKTTLAYAIPRFVQPESGRVLIDDIDIARVTQDSLRSQIGFVFQETALFDASVEANIRVGLPGASDAQVQRAAAAAGADEFIEALPEGYRTRLGRAGGKLSVGQKQRLAIARALVREAPILIFDEPTSALDTETEQHLLATLREAARTRCVVVISHRLSSVRAADQILFVAEGRVLERGSHDELMARPDGAYRRFATLQTRGLD